MDIIERLKNASKGETVYRVRCPKHQAWHAQYNSPKEAGAYAATIPDGYVTEELFLSFNDKLLRDALEEIKRLRSR